MEAFRLLSQILPVGFVVDEDVQHRFALVAKFSVGLGKVFHDVQHGPASLFTLENSRTEQAYSLA
jgi:hypothetical protein